MLIDENSVGWGGVGESGRDNYLITDESRPAPAGASLGWLLQLDGDDYRNAFLNSPWVTAVLPIRPGKEQQALQWLQKEHVEGTDGLVDSTGAPTPLKAQLDQLATELSDLNADVTKQLATETVYENGFDPLAGGFRSPGNPEPGTPYVVFDQWIEVLPTDQVVAIEYTPTL